MTDRQSAVKKGRPKKQDFVLSDTKQSSPVSPMSETAAKMSRLSTDDVKHEQMDGAQTEESSPVTEEGFHKLPCQELIYVFLDRSAEINQLPLHLSDGTKVKGFERLKKVVRMFVWNKAFTDSAFGPKKHRFGLIYKVGEDPTLLVNNVEAGDFLNALEHVPVNEGASKNEQGSGDASAEVPETDNLELGSVFQTIADGGGLPPEEILSTESFRSRKRVVRVILFISRSRVIPELRLTEENKKLLNRSDFVVDVVYLHEYPNGDQYPIQCIYDQLLNVTNEWSFIFEMGPNITNLHNCTAQLLLSPCLRPKQTLQDTVKMKTPETSRKQEPEGPSDVSKSEPTKEEEEEENLMNL